MTESNTTATSSGWRSTVERLIGPGLTPMLAVAIPALVALVIAVVVFAQRANAPITGDGATILAERYPLSPAHLLIPLHRQLNALPILIWAFLDGPAPKLALLLALHVALTTVTAAFLTSRIGPIWTLALVLSLAVSGSANYDLLFPWQIVFLLPMLLVMLATWLSVERENRSPIRRLAVLGLLGQAVLSSNLGVVAIFALGLWFFFERRWTQIMEMVPLGLFFVVWYYFYAIRRAHNPIAHPGQFTQGSPEVVPIYIGTGIAHGIGGWFGIHPHLATAAGAVVILAFLGFVIVRGVKIPSAFFSFFAGLFAMFAALSLIRSNADPNQAAGGRYHYLVLFMLAAGLGAAAWPKIRASPWLIAVGVIAALLNLQLLLNALVTTP